MMTIAPSIIPTDALARWRTEHSDRYPFVLSDSSPSTERSSFDPSCIRNRKAWLIDHTLYVSSRSEGTHPLQSPSPREFHEMQWSSEYGNKGRLVKQREISIVSSQPAVEPSLPDNTDITSFSAWSKKHRYSSSQSSTFSRLVKKLGWAKAQSNSDQARRSWFHEAGSLFRDRTLEADSIAVPLPDGCNIPNAIFARKYQLVDMGDTLPHDLHTNQMPTAEFKATNIIVEAAHAGLLDDSSQWLFRGPFTPQLGFDGGLDYQWGLREPSITIRRFDVDCHHEAEGELLQPSVYKEGCPGRIESPPTRLL